MVIKNHKLFVDKIYHNKSQTILDRLVNELEIKQLYNSLIVYSTKFKIKCIDDTFNFCILTIKKNKKDYNNKNINNIFEKCKYKLIDYYGKSDIFKLMIILKQMVIYHIKFILKIKKYYLQQILFYYKK